MAKLVTCAGFAAGRGGLPGGFEEEIRGCESKYVSQTSYSKNARGGIAVGMTSILIGRFQCLSEICKTKKTQKMEQQRCMGPLSVYDSSTV
jgi:hypothetical protein